MPPPGITLIISMLLLLIQGDINICGLGRVHDFFFYFYLGFAMKRGYLVLPVVRTLWKLLLLPVAITVVFICNKMIKQWYIPYALFDTIICNGLLELTHMLCAFLMIVFLYSLANSVIIQQCLNRHPWLIKMSGYCYGVYIYQQFILIYLYYHTSLAEHVSSCIFPWIGFSLTVILSLALCHLTLKTRLGRYMIG